MVGCNLSFSAYITPSAFEQGLFRCAKEAFWNKETNQKPEKSPTLGAGNSYMARATTSNSAKEYESRRDQKGKETTSTTTEKEVTDTGQDPKTLEKQKKHTISRLLGGGLPAKLGIVFFFSNVFVFFCFSKIPQVFGSCVYSNPLEPMKLSVQCISSYPLVN